MTSAAIAAALIFTASAPHVIVAPDWAETPSGEDLAEFYPQAAADAGIPGQATIRCKINISGRLEECSVVDESPPQQGFGDAAVAMSSKFKMRPMSRDGQPVAGAVVRIPIKFALPPPTLPTNLPTLAQATKCYGVYAALADGDVESGVTMPAAVAWSAIVGLDVAIARGKPSTFERTLADARAAASRTAAAQAAKDRQACPLMPSIMATPGG